MFFAGMGGIVSFYPDSISEIMQDEKSWPLVLTDFKVSGSNRFFAKALYECDTIKLNKGDNNFQLSFACLDFKNAEKIKYRYRLGPSEKEFITTGFRNRNLNYASLSPGLYKLEIEATNAAGDWASKKTLVIEIPAFYYQTIWFRMLLTGVLLFVFVYFIYNYNRQIRLKARQQQDELKLESLRGQMNPHFIFNSLNSINYFISQNDRLSANRYIADFSRLIRSILGNLSQEYIPLNKELESLNDYLQLEHLRFNDKFDYEISVDETVNTEDVLVFPGMVQPFIENAIWHGVRGLEDRKGFVKIRFLQSNPDCILAVVEDDGIGRKLAESRKSNLPGKTSRGIGIVLERLKIINHLRQANFQVIIEDLYSDREETGTRVTVEIPVKVIANS
jgi:two-component sensor histidine kinase